MKYYTYSLILFLIFSIIICEDDNNSSVLQAKEENESNPKRLTEKVKDYLKGLYLENKKTITKEELKTIFITLFNIATSELEIDNNVKESNLSMIKFFADSLYNILATKEKDIIEIDKIIEYFSPQNIRKYIDNILISIGLEKYIEPIVNPLLTILEKLFLNSNKISEL